MLSIDGNKSGLNPIPFFSFGDNGKKEKLTQIQKIKTIFMAAIAFSAMTAIAPKMIVWTIIIGFVAHDPVNKALYYTVDQIKGIWEYSKILFVTCCIGVAFFAFPQALFVATVCAGLHYSAKAGEFIHQYRARANH